MRTSRLWSLAGIFIALALLIATGWALRRDDDAPPLPAAPATVEATQTPRPAASAVAPTPFRQPAPTVPPLVPFPENAVMIVAHGGYAHGGGGYFSLSRHYRDRKGELRTDQLLKPPGGGTAVLTGIVANELGELFASTCFGDLCGYESGTERSNTVFTRSTDGGMTWREIGSSAGKWWARAAVDEGVVVINFEGQSPSYSLFPRGTPIVPPPAARDSVKPILFRGQLAWIAGTEILNRGGARLYELEFPGYPNVRVESVLALQRGGPTLPGVSFPTIVASWSADGLPGQRQFFVGTFLPPIGTPLKVVKIEGGAPRLAGFLNERDLLVTQDYVRPGTCTSGGDTSGADPAIIPCELGLLSFIGTPFYDRDCSQGTQLVVSTRFIAIGARVKGDGDCVNLRRDPSIAEPVVDCLGDGAIVNTGKARSNDGTRSWQSVIGPSGQAGWMADEFLE